MNKTSPHRQDSSGSFVVPLFASVFERLHFISPSKGLKAIVSRQRPSWSLYALVDWYVLGWMLWLVVLFVLSGILPQFARGMAWLILPLSVVRLLEIGGVTFDVLLLDRVRAELRGEPYVIASPDRTFLLGVLNYVEILLHFALLYFLVFGTSFEGKYDPDSIWDALYFSSLTITTLGYGDVRPTGTGVRLVSVCEAIAGVLALALIIARGVSLLRRPDALSEASGDNAVPSECSDLDGDRERPEEGRREER